MRRYFGHPAEQLGSVAERFRRRGRRGERARPGCNVFFLAPPSDSFSRRSESKSASASERIELSPEEKQRRVEAVLFVAREPLSSRKLSHYAGLADGTEARTIVKRLNARYDASGRAFRVESIAGGHQLLTRPKFGDWVRRAAHAPAHQRLSSPALETLAVIAYRQPIPRVEIEAIRGVNCGEILRQLMDRDLVRIAGRSDELGRPYLYATTRRFLQTFGLADLADLPNAILYGRATEVAAADSNTDSNTVPQPGPQSTNPGLAPTNPDVPEEKSDVTITAFSETRSQDPSQRCAASPETDWPLSAYASGGAAVAFDEDEEVDDEESDDDEDDDYEDDDEDFDDEDFDDDDFDDEDMDDEELAEEEFEDEEWEEVGDDDEEDDEDDDEEDWDEE